MRICPTCRTAYPARGRSTCTRDGTRLISAEEFAAAQNDPLLGRTIGERFEVIERIGTGGMGTVYRARQSGLDREVALKVLRRELISDRDTVARFHREAKAMSMLMHPNTVRVFDFGEDDDGHLFLSMELLEGELLTAWIEREGTPPVDEAIEVIRAILGSLGEAHSKSLIHRDLKPDNIFLARVEGHARPVVKVLDFGIAKVFREERKIDQLETQAGTVFGTPRYMSPEQAQGNALDHRSDLYSVGVLLYQLLTGAPPFLDDDAVVVMAKHIREEPEPPRRAAPDQPIPRRLERAVTKALAKEPEGRFDNAEALAAELAACLPDVEAERDRRRSGKGGGLGFGGLPKAPLAIAAGVIALAVVIAVVLVGTGRPDEVASAQPNATLAAPAPETPPVGAPPAPPSPVETVVELRSDPEGAEVWVGEDRRGVTPVWMTLVGDEAVEVEVRLSRHDAERVTLTADAAPVRLVELTRTAPVRRSPRAAPSTEAADPADDEPYDRW